MAEQNNEQQQSPPTLERSRNLGAVIQATLTATRKIGASILKISRDIVGMIFK